MIVSLLNRDLEISDDMQSLLTDFLLERLSRTEDGRASLSHTIEMIRSYARVKFPTRLCDAENVLEALDFTLVRERDHRGTLLRTYVTV